MSSRGQAPFGLAKPLLNRTQTARIIAEWFYKAPLGEALLFDFEQLLGMSIDLGLYHTQVSRVHPDPLVASGFLRIERVMNARHTFQDPVNLATVAKFIVVPQVNHRLLAVHYGRLGVKYTGVAGAHEVSRDHFG